MSQDFTTEDAVLTLAFQVVNLADAYTTLHALDNGAVEGNPLIGSSKQSVLTFLGIVGILQPFIVNLFPLPERRYIQYTMISVKVIAVGNNIRLIIRFNL